MSHIVLYICQIGNGTVTNGILAGIATGIPYTRNALAIGLPCVPCGVDLPYEIIDRDWKIRRCFGRVIGQNLPCQEFEVVANGRMGIPVEIRCYRTMLFDKPCHIGCIGHIECVGKVLVFVDLDHYMLDLRIRNRDDKKRNDRTEGKRYEA